MKDTESYHELVSRLRDFFMKAGFQGSPDTVPTLHPGGV